MKSKVKSILSVLLTMCMLVTMIPVNTLAADFGGFSDGSGFEAVEETVPEQEISVEETVSEQDFSIEEVIPEQEAPVEGNSDLDETQLDEAEFGTGEDVFGDGEEPELDPFSDGELVEAADAAMVKATAEPRDTSGDDFYKLVHLDAARKYFSPANIKKIIDTAAEAGYNQVELYVSDNQGFRLALDDMKVTTSTGKSYDLTPALGDGYSDGSKYPDGSGKYLTQSEMTDIIEYAKSKGIDIVPCVNVPGHMGAILEVFTQFRYGKSQSSIDLENTEAVAFALAITEKYAAYFQSQGVKFYNVGADEYANDLSSMGFEGLYNNGKYQKFVDFLNNAAQIVINHGMTPRAFNDGIYYNNKTSYNINKAIQVCYWSSGWSGYNVASPKTIANQGHAMINTHGDYYWVLGNNGWQCNVDKASGFNYKSFQGGTINNPAGAMFCIWCDDARADSQENVVSKTAEAIKAFGDTLPETEPNIPDEEKTVTDNEIGISVTAPGLESVTATMVEEIPVIDEAAESKVIAYEIVPSTADGKYEGEAKVTFPVAAEWNAEKLRGFVVNTDGTITKDIVGTYADGFFTFIVPHFSTVGYYELAETSEETPDIEEKTITLSVGETTDPIIQEGVDNTGKVNKDELDENIASVTVNKKDVPAVNGYQLVANGAAGIEPGEKYLIVSGNSGSPYALTSTGGRTQVTVSNGVISRADNSAVFTLEQNGNGYNLKDSNGRYLYPNAMYSNRNWNYSLSINQTNGSAVTITGNSSVTIGRSVTSSTRSTTAYIRYGSSSFSFSSNATSSNLYLFKEVNGTASVNTEITFTGKKVGTTYVTVGNTRYTIVVEDKAPAGALTGNTLTVEYWITNSQVRASASNNAAVSATISRTQAESEEGVAIASIAPETGYSNYDGWIEVKYWQAMRLDSAHHQIGDSSVDQTGVGTTLTHVRYRSGAWQYKGADGIWRYFMTGDQLVAYYMRHTEITKEITTAMKDWGYGTGGTTPNTSGGSGQVALSVAVVYPDHTVSPSEANIYGNSTTIFNYWAGRDIGIIAPLNNSDYEIEKITVTDGSRTKNTTSNTWEASDTITWSKKTVNDEGDQWYDETELWNDSMDTAPMVNGKVSNVTWSKKNTAKLVLIYLKPVHHESNLVVKYVDDSLSGALIHQGEVVVAYEGVETPITFLNGLKQTSSVHSGTFTLDDSAFIINSSGVQQTFNKKIALIDGVADQYKTGLYTYISADISEDGKTLTLHYNLDASKVNLNYVVDFGLPVRIPLGEIADNATEINTEVSNGAYGSAVIENNELVYTPTKVIESTDVITAKVSGATVRIGFVPATTVYYEDSFANYIGTWTKGATNPSLAQKASKAGSKDHYGYDDAYTESVNVSGGSETVTSTQGSKAEFTFKGTGVDIYANCTSGTGIVSVINQESGKITNIIAVDTAMRDGAEGGVADNYPELAYNVPIASIRGLDCAVYKVTITYSKSAQNNQKEGIRVDGFRVYNTLGNTANDIYAQDNEANPIFWELRDSVLCGLLGTNESAAGSEYANQIAANIMSNVYAKNQDGVKALLISSSVNNVTSGDVIELIDNGPKNEIYLHKGDKLIFETGKNATNVQIGLKALNAGTSYTINNSSKTLTSSTDMFYKIVSGKVEIVNTGDGILSVTKIKMFGTAELKTISEAFVTRALLSMGYEKEPAPVEAASLTLNTNALNLPLGSAVALTATVAPENAIDKTVTWSVDDKKVATVDANGAVTGVGFGNAIVTATTVNGITATCEVTVAPAAPELNNEVAVDKNGKVTLTWNAVKDAKGYIIYQKSGNGWEKAGTANNKTTSCTVNGLKSGTYTFIVVAYAQGKGENYRSGHSNEVTVTVTAKGNNKK